MSKIAIWTKCFGCSIKGKNTANLFLYTFTFYHFIRDNFHFSPLSQIGISHVATQIWVLVKKIKCKNTILDTILIRVLRFPSESSLYFWHLQPIWTQSCIHGVNFALCKICKVRTLQSAHSAKCTKWIWTHDLRAKMPFCHPHYTFKYLI